MICFSRVFDPPTDIETALADLESLFESPSLTLLGEGVTHFAAMRQVLLSGRPAGNLLHDAHIAALLMESGVREF